MLSVSNFTFLQSWGFMSLYGGYQTRLMIIAKRQFGLMKTISGGLVPDQIDFAQNLETGLIVSVVFADIIADLCTKQNVPGPQDPFWPYYFAEPVAQFMIDVEWQDIIV